MNTFSLKIGSEFSIVDATYRITRVLAQREVIAENIETGDVQKFTVVEVLSAASNNSNSLDIQNEEEHSRSLDIFASDEIAEARYRRRICYVKHIRQFESQAIAGKTIASLIGEAAAKISDISPPSLRTISRWLRKYDQDQLRVASRHRRLRKEGCGSRALAIQIIQQHYLSKNQETQRDCFDRFLVQSERDGLKKLSLSSFRRILKSEFSAFEIVSKRFSECEAKKRFRTPFKDRHPVRPYQVLEVDHTILDWVVVSDDREIVIGRPTMACVVDVSTKYIVAAYLSFLAPSTATVMSVLKMAFFPKDMDAPEFGGLTRVWHGGGLPETLIMDNGVENHSNVFQSFFQKAGLAVNVEYCAVRSPWQKPHIERFFADAAKFLKTSSGRIKKPGKTETRLSTDDSATLTFNELRQFLYRWIEEVHNETPHSRTQLIPRMEFEKGMSACPPLEIPLNAEHFDFFSTSEIERQVGPHGVVFNDLTYGGPSLHELKKKIAEKFMTRIRYNPENLSMIYVLDPSEKNWIKAFCTDQKYSQNLSLAEHLSLKRHRKKMIEKTGSRESLAETRVSLLNDISDSVKTGQRLKLHNRRIVESHVKKPRKTLIQNEIDEQIQRISAIDFEFDPQTISTVRVLEDLE